MKTALAVVGSCVLALFILGSFGVGNFRLFYGPNDYDCTKVAPENISLKYAEK